MAWIDFIHFLEEDMAGSSQKFIARNRAPRVQIEYEVETGDAQKKVQIPFVMGVLADLSGKPADPLAPVDRRNFDNIDVDNFDSKMKATKPRVAYSPPPLPTITRWPTTSGALVALKPSV